MFSSININKYNTHGIIFCDKTRNNIIQYGHFHRIKYSTDICTSTCMYINFNLKNVDISKYFSKIKCSFNYTDINSKVINHLKNIELSILQKFSIHTIGNLIPKFTLSEQLKHDFLKIFSNKNILLGKKKNMIILLKISGIWTNETEMGITFRFFI